MKRALWTASFLTITATAVAMELWASFDSSSNTAPWTDLIVHSVPQAVTMAAIGILVAWLPSHFRSRYDKKSVGAIAVSLAPDVSHPRDPLVTRAVVVAVATAVLNVVTVFGIPISGDQKVAILALINVTAPIVLGIWARKSVFSPASVSALLAAKGPAPGPAAGSPP